MKSAMFCRSCDCLQQFVFPAPPKNLEDIEQAGVCIASQQNFTLEDRILSPQENGSPISWKEALSSISQAHKAIKKTPNQLGLYIDQKTLLRGYDSLQSYLFVTQLGTTSFFSDLSRYDMARLLMTEKMIGHATPLLSDLGRTHYLLHLGSDHEQGSWGHLQPTLGYEKEIAHSQRTKKTKVVIAHPQKSAYAEKATQFTAIRPGTESFLLLGMVQISIKSGWIDQQFVDQYTTGFSNIISWINQFPLEKCAEICGITASELSGLALQFTRAPMALAHPNLGTFTNENGTLGTWAWLVLHAISANLLRPGALYESQGSLDLMPALAAIRSDDAPISTQARKLVLMQNTTADLIEAIENKQITQLIIAADDFLYPQRTRFFKALETLDLVVVISEKKSLLTEKATIVLPRTSTWEEDDILFHRNINLPYNAMPVTKAIRKPLGQSKPLWQILSDISSESSFSLRHSSWGLSTQLLSKTLSFSTAPKIIKQVWKLLNEDDLSSETDWNKTGETNRAEWRVKDDKIQLDIPILKQLFDNISIPETSAEYPFLLHTSSFCRTPSINDIPQITVHPSAGFTMGEMVSIKSPFGQITVKIQTSTAIREDSISCSFWSNPEILDILPIKSETTSGIPVLDGIPCSVVRL